MEVETPIQNLHQCYPATSNQAHLLRTSSGVGAAALSAASAVKSTPNRPENILQYIYNRGNQRRETNGLLQCTHNASIQLHLRAPFYTCIILPTPIPHQGHQGGKKQEAG